MADSMLVDEAAPTTPPLSGSQTTDAAPAAAKASTVPAAARVVHEANTESLEAAAEVLDARPDEAAAIYRSILSDAATSAEALRVKELATNNLGEILARQGKTQELRQLLTELRPFFALIPKAKTAKIVRTIIDLVAKIPNSTASQLELCKEMVEWTKREKRTFLRQRVEARLAALYMETKDFQMALSLTTSLVREVRRLDDKLLLVDIDLLESKLYLQLRNIPKAKAALTAARTAANAVYVPPVQQGQIDMQSGILHAEEKDYKTAYSYFFEAFEGFNSLDDPRAMLCLKYMLLSKVMMNVSEDVPGLIAAKGSLKYVGPDLDAMKAVAAAHSKRSLKDFEEALRSYREQLADDPIISRHLEELYDSLLEQNLLRLVEPFSRVEIDHIAKLISLPLNQVEGKLSQMILDGKIDGTLDQGVGCLIVFEKAPNDVIYPSALETISHMSKVVDSLYTRSAKVMA